MVNAAAIGYVGVLVGWDAQETKVLANIQCYLDFLNRFGKITGRLGSVIVIERSKFTKALEAEARRERNAEGAEGRIQRPARGSS